MSIQLQLKWRNVPSEQSIGWPGGTWAIQQNKIWTTMNKQTGRVQLHLNWSQLAWSGLSKAMKLHQRDKEREREREIEMTIIRCESDWLKRWDWVRIERAYARTSEVINVFYSRCNYSYSIRFYNQYDNEHLLWGYNVASWRVTRDYYFTWPVWERWGRRSQANKETERWRKRQRK